MLYLQISAGYGDHPKRLLHLFGCRSSACGAGSNAWRVLRSAPCPRTAWHRPEKVPDRLHRWRRRSLKARASGALQTSKGADEAMQLHQTQQIGARTTGAFQEAMVSCYVLLAVT